MRLIPTVIVLLAALALGVPPRAEAWTLPPVDGELAGEFSATMLPGAPVLHWKAALRRRDDKTRHIEVTIDGDGTRLRIEGDMTVNSGDGRWRIVSAEIDTKRWLAPLGPKLGSSAANLAAEGMLRATGAGEITAGRLKGTIKLQADRVSLADTVVGWKLDGITVDAEFAFDAGDGTWRSAGPATLSVAKISSKRFGAQNLKLTARLKDAATAELLSGSIEIAGGEVVATPATIPLRPVNAQLDVRFTHIGLQDIAQFVPNAVAEAYGLVDGRVHLGWTAANGFTVGRGQLALRDDAPATVRLVQMPGVITSNIPQNVVQFYQGLDKVEQGLIPIEATSLIVTFTPEGDAEGRQAYVHLAGTYPHARAPLDLTVNIRGPIGALLKMSTDSRLHFGGK